MGSAELILGALRLDPMAFDAAVAGGDLRLALVVLLLAGLSHAIGQSVALFVSRVRPRRFVLALTVNALIFAASVLAWALALDLAAWAWPVEGPPFATIVVVVGLGHAPRLFGTLTLIPYFGALIGRALSIWTLLATAVGARTVLSLDLTGLMIVLVGAWILTEVAERTVGRPIVALAHVLRRWGSGVSGPQERGA